ncbi:hypothetical protein ES708_33287 [subsurface metagenome]
MKTARLEADFVTSITISKLFIAFMIEFTSLILGFPELFSFIKGSSLILKNQVSKPGSVSLNFGSLFLISPFSVISLE